MNTGKTVFSQIIDFASLNEFRKCVRRYNGHYKVQIFTCMDQFLCMAFAQLTFRESLRDIEACLRSLKNKLYHIGIRGKVSRSTLADANNTRDWRIYADFAQILIHQARDLYSNEKFGVELDNTVYALDSTTIELCLSLFPWASYCKKQAGVRMHTQNRDRHLLIVMNHPDFTQLRRLIDDAITFNDLKQAKKLALEGLDMAQEMEILGEQMFFRAQLEIIDDHFEEAIKYLDKAIKYNSLDGAAFNDRALCMIELGIIDGVLKYFDKGIEVEPDYETIYHNKGWFLNKLGQHQESLDLFNKALELEPNRAVTYENIGNAYENLGRIDEAIVAYNKALSLIDPSFEDIKKQINGRIERLS